MTVFILLVVECISSLLRTYNNVSANFGESFFFHFTKAKHEVNLPYVIYMLKNNLSKTKELSICTVSGYVTNPEFIRLITQFICFFPSKIEK